MSRRRVVDPELSAVHKVSQAVEELSPNGQLRVLRYCLERAYERATGQTATIIAHQQGPKGEGPPLQ